MVRLSRKRFIRTAAGLVLPAWACSGQVVIPGAIMRTIAAGGGGSCSTQRDAEESADTGFEPSFSRYYASMFRAGATYSTCRIDVRIAKNASEDSDLFLTLRANNAGSPNSVVLGTSSTVAIGAVGTDFGWVQFDFSSAVSLTSGSDYWIVITRVDAADGLQIYWEVDADAVVENMKEAANATPTTWNVISASAAGKFRTFSN